MDCPSCGQTLVKGESKCWQCGFDSAHGSGVIVGHAHDSAAGKGPEASPSVGLVEVIGDGFRIWVNNKVLGAPYLLSLASLAVVVGVLSLIAFLSYSWFGVVAGIIVGLAMLLIAFIALLLIPSFFNAAGIEMAADALEGRKPSLSDSFNPGWGGVKKLLIINIVIGLVMFSIFAVLYVIQVVLKIDVILPAAVVTGCVLLFAPYYAVLTGKGWIDSVKSSYSTFSKNRLFVFILWCLNYQVAAFSGVLVLPVLFLTAGIMAFACQILGLTLYSVSNPLFIASVLLVVFVFLISAVLLSSLVIAPLVALWNIGALKRLGGVK